MSTLGYMSVLPARVGTRTASEGVLLRRHMAYVERLVAAGGPDPSEYAQFNAWLDEVAGLRAAGLISDAELAQLRCAFGDALSADTVQGFSFSKPHGYSGDFEVIDRIYRQHVSGNPLLSNWDRYAHAQSGTRAVRNRKGYFVDLLCRLEQQTTSSGESRVLNVASGPCRDLLEYFQRPRNGAGETHLAFDCVDMDSQAIEYASELCAPYTDQITFLRANALRFQSSSRYRLIWSAGLFDYLSESAFVFLLQRLYGMLAEDGELVVGNFAIGNPTRPYMEIIGDWHLYHRSTEDLIALARRSGIDESAIRVGREAEGVNLFLHVRKAASFL